LSGEDIRLTTVADQFSIFDVFKTQGRPTITYVARDEGVYERRIEQAVRNAGTVCLLTGPSKTGKTTLYSKVAESLGLDLIRARCDKELSAKGVWEKALEDVDFDRPSTRQRNRATSTEASAELEGTIGWKWLAGLMGKAGVKINGQHGESAVRERILADASPSHLVCILKRLPTLFVLEDFHYLPPDVQRTLFQQCKVFVDNEVSIVIVGTTHHAVDLAYANRDLLGRLTHIDVPTWKQPDLVRIAR